MGSWFELTFSSFLYLYRRMGPGGRGGGEGVLQYPQNLGNSALIFWAAREIWAKLIFKDVCMCVRVAVFFSK